jgi:hypothetical protein
MKVITTSSFGGKSHNVDFVANVKAHTAPKIEESFIDDEGEIIHILANGNTQKDTLYTQMWGTPKGAIKPKSFKGNGLDGRTNWM